MEAWLEVHHLILIIVVLILALIALGGGKGLGMLIKPLFNRLLGKSETNLSVTIEGGDMAGAAKKDPCATCNIVDPSKCPLHEAEHERSKRNEAEISALWMDLKETRTKLFTKLDTIEKGIGDLRVEIAKLPQVVRGNGG